jgi:hypothetical protein
MERFSEEPTQSELEQVRFQVFHQTKQYELAQQIYPICASDCINRGDTKRKEVFLREELECANNCIQKYRTSMGILLSYITTA